VGKTTQITRLAEFLRHAGIDVVVTREPGGTQVAEAIRTVLLDKALPAMHADTELMLMYAARVEHVQHLIKPALAKGQWVLSDRFADASHVYQGAGRGVDPTRVDALDAWTLQGFAPDKTILFDMPVEQGMARVRSRGVADRFEEEKLEFFERVREGYLARARAFPDRFVVIDASQEMDTVTADLVEIVQQWMT
jgi:dTMP kinase